MRHLPDVFALHGPLGLRNMRRQQGKSRELGPSLGELREALVFSGSPNKSAQDEGVLGDALASTLTITCSLRQNAGTAGVVRGTVRWGSDGHQTEAAFDWVHGTVVQVVGSFVEVIAELVEYGENTLVNVGAFVGYFSAQRLPATLTQAVAAPIAPGLAAPVLVPAFASRLHVAAPLVGQAYTATFLDAAGAALAAYNQVPFAAGARVPVPNGAQSLQIASGGAAFVAALIYELTI